MNLMMVDLTDCRPTRVGDVVTLLGPGISAETLADLIGTIHYEVTTRIAWHLPRLIVR
jgi:alanine racemase